MSANTNKIFVGSDHAGFGLKMALLEELKKSCPDLQFEDLGCHDTTSVHYPDYAKKVGEAVAKNNARGILVCGSGIGVAIAANKVNGVRAATVWDTTSARLSKEHNNANVICWGARLIGPEVVFEASKVWLKTKFLEGRHAERVELIRKMEEA